MLPGRAAAAGEANENMPQEVDKLGGRKKASWGGSDRRQAAVSLKNRCSIIVYSRSIEDRRWAVRVVKHNLYSCTEPRTSHCRRTLRGGKRKERGGRNRFHCIRSQIATESTSPLPRCTTIDHVLTSSRRPRGAPGQAGGAGRAEQQDEGALCGTACSSPCAS